MNMYMIYKMNMIYFIRLSLTIECSMFKQDLILK